MSEQDYLSTVSVCIFVFVLIIGMLKLYICHVCKFGHFYKLLAMKYLLKLFHVIIENESKETKEFMHINISINTKTII